MEFYAKFDAEGFPTAFYNADVWGEDIPADAVAITEAQWLEFINNAGWRKWADGEVVEYVPPPQPEPFPSEVTAAQAKIALHKAGLLEQVKAIVAAHSYEIVRIWFADANDWERGNAYVQALGVELGLTNEEIDSLFVAASKI